MLVTMGAGPAEAGRRRARSRGPRRRRVRCPMRVYRPTPDETPRSPSSCSSTAAAGPSAASTTTTRSPGGSRTAAARVVVSVGYRLAPEHPHPARARRLLGRDTWVAEHAAEIGGDPVALRAHGRQRGRQHRRGARASGAPARAVRVPRCRCSCTRSSTATSTRGRTARTARGTSSTPTQMHWFFDCYTRGGTHPSDPTISPLRDARSPRRHAHDIAPAFVITAEFDPLRDEGEAYVGRAR